MEPDQRQRSPRTGTDRELLASFLEFQRQTIIWKISGLSEADLRTPRTRSGMTLLGIVKHLAYAERFWFQYVFLGEEVFVPWQVGKRGEDFQPGAEESPAFVIAFYQAETALSQQIVAEADSLDAMAQYPQRQVSLRWILLHMIEETARHCGHIDLMREETDGQTGT